MRLAVRRWPLAEKIGARQTANGKRIGQRSTANGQQETSMLEMKNIKKIYRTDMIETHALEDFSLLVQDGEFVAIMGPSGSGKTTFLNVAGLLDTFESGTYLLDGKD